ncbi:MAG: biotin--acetyl-CoA-carboxylase ligase [SAR86 cluster bacterium]|uniref:Biotin--acetyl-CoA-carboxylase ligase n=1 Tax=SAR86 cluster bacterium TaxID=2030880 RepID=A0A2A4XI25_9GAMM|nr:MAG: biotin--acetyl-CoA-carboxylase ligase [SAR86 cluster bacterium]
MLLLFEVSDRIGSLTTLGLVVATAVIGVQILKRQGFATLTRANQKLQSGQLPAQEIVEGMLLAAAGALLLTPGFITDTIGFVLLTGPLRRPIARSVVRSGMVKAMGGSASGANFRQWSSGGSRQERPDGSNVYEGDYHEEPGSLPENERNPAADSDKKDQ